MAEDIINISDCDEEEMRQLFQDGVDHYKLETNNSVHSGDFSQNNSQTQMNGQLTCQTEGKKKAQRKSSSRQRAGSSTGRGSEKSSSSRKGRQSKTPSSSQGRHSRSEGDFNVSPCREGLPIFTSDIHPVDNTFKLSLLDEVLTEKKMALMKSPEVMQFLKDQQAAKQESTKTKQQQQEANS
ncbi:hypothetical protein LOTGIDRAFT_238912 [Lottia gigantea]|uniref:Uncharacterized protein n=1 Tax=Lottia gigantea TaxID=225164 RepID=V4CB86_LOTGI|nr:hypothetical protein LOTGIDRAFT_238912 [Lottia gigantea]ESO99104.1 hypothetical protein LOTGIDRAFT_238912 [Lottia gigantea]